MREVKIGDNDYVIRNFMLNLDLTKSELLLYALIYDRSNEGAEYVILSNSYMCAITNLTKSTVIAALNKLIGKGLIVKKSGISNSVTYNEFNIL